MNPFDYKDVDPEAAVKDYMKRRENYIDIYETVDERDGPHIKVINNQTYIVHNVRGYLPQKVRHGNACFASPPLALENDVNISFQLIHQLRALRSSRWSTS